MTSSVAPAHPVAECVREVSAALDAVKDVDPVWMRTTDKAAVLRDLVCLEGRLASLRMRVAVEASDVADGEGSRSVADWLAHHTRQDRPACVRDQDLATALTRTWRRVGAGLDAGRVNLAQARAIVAGLDRLPDDTDPEILARAEAHLVGLAERHTPRELRVLAAKVLDVVAPDVAESAEQQRLADEEAKAREETSLRFTDLGDGTVEICIRVSRLAAARLKTYLEAYTSPRHHQTRDHQSKRDRKTPTEPTEPTEPAEATEAAEADLWSMSDESSQKPADPPPHRPPPPSWHRERPEAPPWYVLGDGPFLPRDLLPPHQGPDIASPPREPVHVQRGRAFLALLEDYDPTRLPIHGGDATTLIVRIDAETLTTGTGVAETLDGTRLTAGEARRLACRAGLLPVVLGTDSAVLDKGRSARLFDRHQRQALLATHSTCQAAGCTIPATWCEAHHATPWSHGGPTDLANALLLCSHHHHLAHDPGYDATTTDGRVTLIRR